MLLGAQGNLGARRFRLEWCGRYAPRENGPRGNALDPRRGLERLGIRGHRPAAFEDHSRLPYGGGWLLVCSDAQELQVAGYCCRGYIQLPCDQAPGYACLDVDGDQLATFGRGNLWRRIYLRVCHLTFAVQNVRR